MSQNRLQEDFHGPFLQVPTLFLLKYEILCGHFKKTKEGHMNTISLDLALI